MKATSQASKTVKMMPNQRLDGKLLYKGNNPFAHFVAQQAAAKAPSGSLTTVLVPTQPVQPARAVLAEQNGRKSYTPGSIGHKIWETADKLQHKVPNTPVTASAMRLALPDVSSRSISSGLSHWRKFNGTLRVKQH